MDDGRQPRGDVERIIEWVFTNTDCFDLIFESEGKEGGALLGGWPAGIWPAQVRDGAGLKFVQFRAWQLKLERWVERSDAVRHEGVRLRRSLTKAGAEITLEGAPRDSLDRRLGFLSLCAAADNPGKSLVFYDLWLPRHGLPLAKKITEKPLEFEIFGASAAARRERVGPADRFDEHEGAA